MNPYQAPETLELPAARRSLAGPFRLLGLCLFSVGLLHLCLGCYLVLATSLRLMAGVTLELIPNTDIELLDAPALLLAGIVESIVAVVFILVSWRVRRLRSRRWVIAGCVLGFVPTGLELFAVPLSIWCLWRLRSLDIDNGHATFR